MAFAASPPQRSCSAEEEVARMAGASSEDAAENAAALVAIAAGGGVVKETPAPEGSAAAAVAGGRQEGFPAVATEETKEDEDAKWVGQYSSTQSILLVGEGDFSFSLALATGFGSGENLVATSLDRYDTLKKMYNRAESNLAKLKEMGAVILHGVDAKRMQFHIDLKMRRFDRVVFNFPHAGFLGKEDEDHVIMEHRAVVKRFLCCASRLLHPDGEVHVSHKTKYPYNVWDIPGLAAKFALYLSEQADFHIADYPGYSNKRGDGASCDEPFMLGNCSAYKFRKGYRKPPISRPRLVPRHLIGNGGVYPNSSAVSSGCRPSYSPPVAPVCQLPIPINTFGVLSGSGFSHYNDVRLENGSVHQNFSAAFSGCRPYHPPSLAPEWPGPYASFSMPPRSGFPHYHTAPQRCQQGFDPQQNSNMAGIIPQDDQHRRYQRQRMLIAKYGRQ